MKLVSMNHMKYAVVLISQNGILHYSEQSLLWIFVHDLDLIEINVWLDCYYTPLNVVINVKYDHLINAKLL